MGEILNWAKLIDFSDDAQVDQALKDLNSLLKVYDKLIATTKKGSSDIVSNQKKVIDSITATSEAVKKLDDATNKDSKAIQEQNEQAKALSNTYSAQAKQIKLLEEEVSKLTKERSAVAKKTSEANNINKEAIKLEAQLGKLTGQSAKETAALKLQIQEKRKALAQEAKVAAGRVTLYQKESARLNQLRKDYRNVALAQKENSKEAKDLLRQITPLDAKLKRLDKTVGQGQRSVGLYSQAFNNLSRVAGALGFTGVIFGLVSAFRSAFKTLRDFDKEIRNLAALAGVTRKELKGVEDEIRRVGKTSINTALEVAKTATALVTLGKSREEVINLLKPVNDLSIALQAPAAAAGELLIQTLNAFGKSSDSAQEYADVIAKIRSSTALDFERIKDSLAFVAPTAKALGLTFQETGALLGVLVDNGIKASRAGRLLSSSFARLNKEGISLDQALASINNSQNKAKTATELFGTESFTLGLILADNTKKVVEYTEAFNNAEGTLEGLTNEQLKSLDSQLKILNSTWDDFILGVDSGEGAIAELTKSLIRGSIAVIEFFDSFNKSDIDIANSFITKNGINSIEEFNSLLSNLEEPLEGQAKRTSELARQYVIANEALVLYNNAQAQGFKTIESFRPVQDEFINSYGEEKDNLDILKDVYDLYNEKLDESLVATKELSKETAKAGGQLEIFVTKLKRFSNEADKVFVKDASELIFGEAEQVEASSRNIVDIVTKSLSELVEANKEADAKILRSKQEKAEKEQLIRDTAFESASIIGNQLFTNNQIRLENELTDLQNQKDFELELAEGNAQKRAQIEKDFAKKEQEIRKQQAKAAKNQALFNVTLNTAEAITKTAATLGFPAAIPFIAASAALGVAQTAAILSQPEPAFEHGGLVETDGRIKVSEKGREMFVDKSGKIGMTGNSGTETKRGMKGSFVIPNKATEALLANGFDSRSMNDESSSKIQRALREEKESHTNRLIVETRKENDLLMRSFNNAMSKMEIHKHHVRRGEMVRDMKKGGQTVTDWDNKNGY